MTALEAEILPALVETLAELELARRGYTAAILAAAAQRGTPIRLERVYRTKPDGQVIETYWRTA